MYRSIILPIAQKDINKAAHHYNSIQKNLGKRFLSQVRESVNFIKRNPFAIAVRYDNVRTIVLHVFPYMLHYLIDEIEKKVIILAVLHTSRDPDIWNERTY